MQRGNFFLVLWTIQKQKQEEQIAWYPRQQAEQQLDELKAEDWDFASKDPAQDVQNPDYGEDSDDVGM